MAGSPEALLEVGYVARAHGVRGELRVGLHDPSSTALLDVQRCSVGGVAFPIRTARGVDAAVLLTLDGLVDRNGAEALKGKPVSVYRDDLQLDDGQFYLVDLVGLALETAEGASWGQIAAVIPGVQDRLVIHDGPIERELPLVDEFVLEVDFERGVVRVKPPEGLPEWPRD